MANWPIACVWEKRVHVYQCVTLRGLQIYGNETITELLHNASNNLKENAAIFQPQPCFSLLWSLVARTA